MVNIFLAALLVTLIMGYTIIPNYFARNISKKVIKNLPQKENDRMIALTFDDGPDEKYTEKVLDILKDYQIQCTFFVVATKAMENKQIIVRMRNEGHQIAMHAYQHKSAWLSLPNQTVLAFQKAMGIFSELNLEIHLFRPTWGTFNACTQNCSKSHDLEVVLWSVNAADWKTNRSPKVIADSIIKQVKSNDIIVLHDSGGGFLAPLNTIEALKIFIPKLIEKGFHFVTIDKGLNHECI